MSDDFTLTVSDVAALLHVRIDEIYRLVRSKRLASRKVNRKLWISKTSYMRLTESRKNDEG